MKNTARSVCTGVSIDLSVESTEAPDRIARLVENAERLCYAEQAIMEPVPVQLSVTLNGARLPRPGSEPAQE